MMLFRLLNLYHLQSWWKEKVGVNTVGLLLWKKPVIVLLHACKNTLLSTTRHSYKPILYHISHVLGFRILDWVTFNILFNMPRGGATNGLYFVHKMSVWQNRYRSDGMMKSPINPMRNNDVAIFGRPHHNRLPYILGQFSSHHSAVQDMHDSETKPNSQLFCLVIYIWK